MGACISSSFTRPVFIYGDEMAHYKSNQSGAIYEAKKPGKYRPHSGAKEAAKAAKRIVLAEAEAKKSA